VLRIAKKMNPPIPSEIDVAVLVQVAFEEHSVSIERFQTGLAHYVYDVRTSSNKSLVARLALPGQNDELIGGVYWSKILRPIGVPLPKIYLEDIQAELTPFPALLIERFPGTDLWHVYPELTFNEKLDLAKKIVSIQEQVHRLQVGRGYGYVTHLEGPYPFQKWREVVKDSLVQSRKRISEIGIFDPHHVDSVQAYLPLFRAYFDNVQPQLFLDDTTTKNVIIDKGQLSGIVDVDTVCFGDSLYTVALTRMSLLNLGYDLDYITCWYDRLGLNVEHNLVLDYYTAVFCVEFMSEIGQSFNQDRPQEYNLQTVRRLERHLDRLLAALEIKK
jgi:aminoglycoside phosphotransferase (APT) family kinase protein